MSFNKVIIVGNLGRAPELRYTPQGTPVCTFSVATNERRKATDEQTQDVTTWFRVTAWGKQAETVSKYLTKGRSVYVEGRLRVEEWADKDGKTRHSLELSASDIQFIDGAQGRRDIGVGARVPDRNSRELSQGSTAARAAHGLAEDSIPF